MEFHEEKRGEFTVKIMASKRGLWTFSICKGSRQIVCGEGSSKATARRDALARLSPQERAKWEDAEGD
jgi:hypothetical protein